MSMGHIRALTILHRAFSHYPVGHRVHILVRYFTAPYLRTIDDIPVGARVLEIGAGHSAWARLITEERAREVIAVDPDLRKSLLPSPSPKIRKVAGFDDCIRGSFDAAVIYDATYRMPLDVRRELFRRVFERLKPGGVFLFKDMDPGHRWKFKWARMQEWISDQFLRISFGEGFIHQQRADVEAMLRGIGFATFDARPVDAGYPHPHILYTARKPA